MGSASQSSRVDPVDAQEVHELAFEWAMSADTKDWDRMRQILAPKLNIDYTDVAKQVFTDISPDDWIKHSENPRVLGGRRMATQHLLGAAKYIKVSDTQITAHYQIRAAHVRWKDDNRTQEGLKGHGHGEMVQHYTKIDGVWKLSGWKPTVFWNEYDFEKYMHFGLTQPFSEL